MLVYKSLTGENVLTKRYLLGKTATIKRFEYSSLGSELKKLTDIAIKECHGLDNGFSFNRDKKKEADPKTLPKETIVRQIYTTVINLLFSNAKIFKNFTDLSFTSKHQRPRKRLRNNKSCARYSF